MVYFQRKKRRLDYEYGIEIGAIIFASAMVVVILIALSTMSCQAKKYWLFKFCNEFTEKLNGF